MTLILVPKGPRRIVELESRGEFGLAMQQADHGPGDQRRKVLGKVYVSDDEAKWIEYATVCEFTWDPALQRLPEIPDELLADLARPSGYRYAQFRWTAHLGFKRFGGITPRR